MARANRRCCFAALAILLVSTASVCLDTLWTLQRLGEPVRPFPFVGLAAVAGGALWLVLRLLREDERLESQVKELAEELEVQAERGEQWKLRQGEPYRAPTGVVESDVELRDQAADEQQGPMDGLLRFNGRLARVLVAAGVLGGLCLAMTVLTAVDWVRLDALGCPGLAGSDGALRGSGGVVVAGEAGESRTEMDKRGRGKG